MEVQADRCRLCSEAGKETLDAVADQAPAWRYKLTDVACVVRQAKREL